MYCQNNYNVAIRPVTGRLQQTKHPAVVCTYMYMYMYFDHMQT